MVFLVEQGPRYGVYPIIGGFSTYLLANTSSVPKYIRGAAQYVLLGMRLQDQNALPRPFNAREAYPDPDRAYLHNRKTFISLKLTKT